MKRCVICLDDIESSLLTSICTCNSLSHKSCLNRWLSRNDTCPYCRKQLKPTMSYYNDSIWVKPFGTIDLTIIDNDFQINISSEHSHNLLVVVKDMENSHNVNVNEVTILRDSNKYVDILNLPVGWILRVNDNYTKTFMQINQNQQIQM